MEWDYGNLSKRNEILLHHIFVLRWEMVLKCCFGKTIGMVGTLFKPNIQNYSALPEIRMLGLLIKWSVYTVRWFENLFLFNRHKIGNWSLRLDFWIICMRCSLILFLVISWFGLLLRKDFKSYKFLWNASTKRWSYGQVSLEIYWKSPSPPRVSFFVWEATFGFS